MKEPNCLKMCNWTIIKIIICDKKKPPKEDPVTLKQCVLIEDLKCLKWFVSKVATCAFLVCFSGCQIQIPVSRLHVTTVTVFMCTNWRCLPWIFWQSGLLCIILDTVKMRCTQSGFSVIPQFINTSKRSRVATLLNLLRRFALTSLTVGYGP